MVAEMVMEMLPAGVLGRLTLVPVATTGERRDGGACPSCGVQMELVNMYGVEVERCPKQHGVWFDPEELQIALRHAADPSRHVDGPHAADAGFPAYMDAASAPQAGAEPFPVPPVTAEAPTPQRARHEPGELVFGIQTPGDVYREVRMRQEVIKIGRHHGCHVRVNDERVGRAHVLIEITDAGPVLIDLGGPDGTLVNGTRVTKHTLASGDQILIGATTLTVTFKSS